MCEWKSKVVYLRVNLSLYIPRVEPLGLGILCIFVGGGGGGVAMKRATCNI